MTDSIAVEAADEQEDKGKGETFLSIFDVPVKNNSRPAISNEDLHDFDPKSLFNEFSNLAEEERIEYEKNEAEVAEKLSAYSNLSEDIEGLRTTLSEINLTEKEARQLPDLLSQLNQTNDELTEKLTSLQEKGHKLEEESKGLKAKITDLKKFLEDFRRQKEANVKKFGGQEKGEERFKQLENKTDQAINQNLQQSAETEAEYQEWKIEAIEALAPILKNLKIAREGDKLSSQSLVELKNDFEIFIRHKQELNERTAPIIDKINEKQALIEDLLQDKRIPERIKKFETEVAKHRSEFVKSIIEVFKPKSQPESTLVEEISKAFYQVELARLKQANSPDKKAESAANLAQSLTRTLNKIHHQANIDLDQLHKHLSNLNQQGTLPPSSKGYNDVLFLAYCLGITGQPAKALETLRTEARAIHTEPKQAELYTDQRLSDFYPVLTAVQAGLDLVNSQPAGQPKIFGNWLKQLEPVLAGLPIKSANPEYSRIHKDLSAAIREFVTYNKQDAQDQARQIELKLKGLLKSLAKTLDDQVANNSKLIKLDSYALTIEQAQEFSSEVAKLSHEYNSLGPIKLGNSAKKLQEEIDRFSKLLLLKVPDLRKAAEIVNFDLGRIDVGAPDTIQPKLESLAETLKGKRLEAKENQAEHIRQLADLKDQVKSDILNNQEIEAAINSSWLDGSYNSELINLYAQVEEEFLNLS